jgi:hypothetical protein
MGSPYRLPPKAFSGELGRQSKIIAELSSFFGVRLTVGRRATEISLLKSLDTLPRHAELLLNKIQ